MARRATAPLTLPPDGAAAAVDVPRLVVRPASQLTPEEVALLRRAGLPGDVTAEAWTAAGTNRQLAYATHGLFRYFGKFPPPLAAHLVERYSAPGDSVLDPMVGSGTTAVECALRGRHVTARDVSPLSLLLTAVKTTPVPAAAAERALERVRGRYGRSGPDSRCDAVRPVGLRDVAHWFLPATTRSLSRLRSAIEEERGGGERDLLLVCFAATVRRVSRATTQQGRLFLDAATALEDAWPTFEARARHAIAAASALAPPATAVEIERRSILSPPPPRGRRHRLVIAHPPYFSNYRYSGVNSLELAWLGHDHRSLREQEIREFFKRGDASRVAEYVDDMAVAVRHMVLELEPQGRLALVMGDAVLRGAYVPATRMLLERLRGLPVQLELAALRAPRFTEASWVASQRRTGDRVGVALHDFVLVFRNGGPA